MLGLRQKLMLGFAGLLAVLLLVTFLAIRVISNVSFSFERISQENLESIQACEKMRSELESLNQILLVSLWEEQPIPSSHWQEHVQAFTHSLDFQKHNVTVMGEQKFTDSLIIFWNDLQSNFSKYTDVHLHLTQRRLNYQNQFLGQLQKIENLTQGIASLNAQNMLSTDGEVKHQARRAKQGLIVLLIAGLMGFVALLFITGQFILNPIRKLTQSAQEIAKGNLELSLDARSRDEMGILAESFNTMTSRLREFRRSDHVKLIRTQRTTQMAINSLPDAVAVINAEGFIEMSNNPAHTCFGIKPGTQVETLELPWLNTIFQKVRQELRSFNPEGYASAIQIFQEGKEHFFLPHAIPILDESKQLVGVTLVLADVTDLRRLDESKSDLLSTVSHELKTRLTSMRMSVHLLLDEKIGDLNNRQLELLLTAREDTEHLHQTIEGLLDIGRIRSGNLKMDLQSIDAREFVLQSIEAMQHAFQDKGLKLESHLPPYLPKVMADPIRIPLVLGNLLSNALKYTAAGGKIEIQAQEEKHFIRFSVNDTGLGIPANDVPHIFEKFYRGSQEGHPGGAGLGLAIAKEVVEAHGGIISLESIENQGTTVHFTLLKAG